MGFSRVALSAADEAQLQKIDELAVASSPAASSLAALLNTANSNLGTTSDAASATGSANAKLAALLQEQSGGTLQLFAVATNSTTAVTLCNISGTSGIFCGISGGFNSSAYPIVSIVVDGTTIVNAYSLEIASPLALPINLKFNSSLQITFASSSSTYSVGMAAAVRTGV